ncbi:phosphodiester glycosidase family protein [Acanthopleuribacter pedis]|uniref:Phosphodiester glycosidase family protein n=1 Tax=Acanthopleuribacter pedis TaxID=442870 RepID=A0A8J7QKI8_9BACT|nr:phosphodiester glycosidase family protein [Acanthopleuribacter pedis]MBO1319898.1 phosphodiester glycosidase family protein [Acanthopleuribacter pedis]
MSVWFVLSALSLLGNPTLPLEWRQGGKTTQIWTIPIPAAQNHGFGFHDAPDREKGQRIGAFWSPHQYQWMVNGGYFEADFSPSGYCRIDGRDLNTRVNPKLSGFLAIDASGRLSMHTRLPDRTRYPTILQTGPHIIDPGGNVGIRRHTGRIAARTVIGRRTNGDLLVLVTAPIDLYDLAQLVKQEIPDIERLLNLDGGPSTALRLGDIRIDNLTPVRNYLYKRKQTPPTP